MYTVRHAKLNRTSIRVPLPSYVKTTKFKGWKLTQKIFEWFYARMLSKKFLVGHFEDVVIDRYDYSATHKDKLTAKIVDVIRNHQQYFGNCNPDTHVILVGEDTFFEYVNEQRIDTPFFYQPATFELNTMFEEDPYYGRRVFNWPVHVVPGFSGFLIAPKAITEVKKYV